MGKVLLLGTGYSSIPIYNVLKNYHEVFVMGANKQDPLAKLRNHIDLDYSESFKVLNYFLDKKFDFVVPACNDLAYRTAAHIGARCDLPAFDDLSAIFLDKLEFRNKLSDKFYNIPFDVDYESLVRKLKKSGKNQILFKPRFSHSGIGIKHVGQVSVNKLGAIGEGYFEKKVEGTLHSHSLFIWEEEIIADFFVDEYFSKFEFAVGKSNIPTKLKREMREKIMVISREISKEFNIKRGLLHLQYIVNEQNCEIFIVEATKRCPGDFYGDLICASTSFDYYDAYISSFINKKPIRLEKKGERPYGRFSIYASSINRLRYLDFNFKQQNNIVSMKLFNFSRPFDLQGNSVSDKVGICLLEFYSTQSLFSKLDDLNVHGATYGFLGD